MRISVKCKVLTHNKLAFLSALHRGSQTWAIKEAPPNTQRVNEQKRMHPGASSSRRALMRAWSITRPGRTARSLEDLLGMWVGQSNTGCLITGKASNWSPFLLQCSPITLYWESLHYSTMLTVQERCLWEFCPSAQSWYWWVNLELRNNTLITSTVIGGGMWRNWEHISVDTYTHACAHIYI